VVSTPSEKSACQEWVHLPQIFGVKIPKIFETTTNKNSFSRWTKFGRPETASSKSDRCDSSINASCHMPVFSHALMALL